MDSSCLTISSWTLAPSSEMSFRPSDGRASLWWGPVPPRFRRPTDCANVSSSGKACTDRWRTWNGRQLSGAARRLTSRGRRRLLRSPSLQHVARALGRPNPRRLGLGLEVRVGARLPQGCPGRLRSAARLLMEAGFRAQACVDSAPVLERPSRPAPASDSSGRTAASSIAN